MKISPTTFNIFSFIGMSIFTFGAFAQTGPAGVGSSSENRVWLDANTINVTDSEPVTSWPDISGNSADFIQGNASQQPLLITSGIGGLPTVSFDGVNDAIYSASLAEVETPNITYFAVYERDALAFDMIVNSQYEGDGYFKWTSYSNATDNRVISAQFSPGIKTVSFVPSAGPAFLSSHITPTNLKAYYQGTLAGTKTSAYVTPTDHINIVLGNLSPTGFGKYDFGGDISEFILYNTAITDLQRILIENYLGAKYGMTIATDWYDYEATHNMGLIGIADDGVDVQDEATGVGLITLSGATDLGASEHFIIAHTNDSLNIFNDVNIPAFLSGSERLERTWKVDELGEVGTTTLTFNLADFGVDFGIPLTYRMLIDTDEDFTSGATIITGTYVPLTGELTFNVNLSDGDVFTIAAVYEPKDINSIVDGPWSQLSTWDCNCHPTYRDNVNIHTGDEVTVDEEAFVQNLTIESGAILTMDEDFTVNIYEDWVITGETNFSAGNIAFVGEVNQDISILTVSDDTIGLFNIIIANEAGGNVTFLNRNYLLTGTLSPNAGNLVIDPSTEFIIGSSSASEGGRVGPILGGTTVTGNFTVQRFIPPGVADWRDLASPVVGSTFDDWDPDLAMSGPGFPDGCAWGPDGCFQSVTYFEADAFIELENSSDPILNGRGFEIFVGNTLTSFDGSTLSSRGTINSSSPLAFNYGDGWSTIGNPYASPISFSTVTRTPEIGNYFYVYDPTSGGFEWYDGASGTSSIPEITEDGLMATGQAVWIFTTGTGTITFNQANKVENDATYIRSHMDDDALRLTLKENAATYSCTMYLEENSLASDGVENDLDIRHLSSPTQKGPSFAMKFGEDLLRKNQIAEDGRDKSFKLLAEVKKEGFYTISADNWGNFRYYRHIYLYDAITGHSYDLKERPYVYHAELNEDEETIDKDRFTLILSNGESGITNPSGAAKPEIESVSVEITQMDHVIDIAPSEDLGEISTITVTNVLGQTEVFSTQTMLLGGSNIITLPENIKGFHIITVRTGNQIISEKVIL